MATHTDAGTVKGMKPQVKETDSVGRPVIAIASAMPVPARSTAEATDTILHHAPALVDPADPPMDEDARREGLLVGTCRLPKMGGGLRRGSRSKVKLMEADSFGDRFAKMLKV